jgi:proteasome lid subunit RPN8/RPN11
MGLHEVILDCLNDKVKDDLKYLALDGMPNEVCGVLHTHHIIHQYANTFPGDKRHGFDMAIHPDDSIVAIWHSHPGGLPSPSIDDIQSMEEIYSKGHFFPWIIVTRTTVMAWEL